jgi:hypothetical protein
VVGHYGLPEIDAGTYRLTFGGMARPLGLTLDEIRDRPRREVAYTIESARNHGILWFIGGVGTALWAGTPLAPLLREAGSAEAPEDGCPTTSRGIGETRAGGLVGSSRSSSSGGSYERHPYAEHQVGDPEHRNGRLQWLA